MHSTAEPALHRASLPSAVLMVHQQPLKSGISNHADNNEDLIADEQERDEDLEDSDQPNRASGKDSTQDNVIICNHQGTMAGAINCLNKPPSYLLRYEKQYSRLLQVGHLR